MTIDQVPEIEEDGRDVKIIQLIGEQQWRADCLFPCRVILTSLHAVSEGQETWPDPERMF